MSICLHDMFTNAKYIHTTHTTPHHLDIKTWLVFHCLKICLHSTYYLVYTASKLGEHYQHQLIKLLLAHHTHNFDYRIVHTLHTNNYIFTNLKRKELKCCSDHHRIELPLHFKKVTFRMTLDIKIAMAISM